MIPRQTKHSRSARGKATRAAWYAANREAEIARVKAWNLANRRRRRLYQALWKRRKASTYGLVKRELKGRGGHDWKPASKLKLRLTMWLKRYNPHLLYFIA